MPTKYTVTLSRMGTSSVIVVPRPVVDGFELKRGQKLHLIVTDEGITIPLTSKQKED
jgi:antitoxin component of MazEF toxin-antitoxin module